METTGESLESQEARKELKRIVEEIAREDERPMSSNFSLKKILGGEFLQAKIIKQYKWLIVIIVGPEENTDFKAQQGAGGSEVQGDDDNKRTDEDKPREQRAADAAELQRQRATYS